MKDIATLINESMGDRECEDRLEKYRDCESIEEIIEKSRDPALDGPNLLITLNAFSASADQWRPS